MRFTSPERADYDRLMPLNRRFLGLLGRPPLREALLEGVAAPVCERLGGLSARQCDGLARTPFLLMSFHEYDDRYWHGILAPGVTSCLFRQGDGSPVDTLVAAGLAYLWHLAQRDAFTLRMICGAPLSWCELIAEQDPHHLLESVRRAGMVPGLRFGNHTDLWQLLLGNGLASKRRIRHAARLSALQTVLTHPAQPSRPAWSRAARSSSAPVMQVADDD